jgi:hypothetical protein
MHLAPPKFQLWHRMQSFPSTITTTNFSTTTPIKAATQFQPLTSGDSIRVSVGHLLTRAFSLPCSTGAMAFAQLVQPNSRFQLALDALLPILDSNKPTEVGIGWILWHPKREADDFSLIASPADLSLIYSVFTVCASSCYGQPLQVGTFGRLFKGAGKGC